MCIVALFIKTFHFTVKYFLLITASCTLTWCPFVGNHSDTRKHRFHAKYIAKKFSRNTFLVIKYIFKIAANQRNILYGKERNHLKNRYSSVFYFHVVLFKMRERDIVTENNLILYYSWTQSTSRAHPNITRARPWPCQTRI